jgi:hypothetical protein
VYSYTLVNHLVHKTLRSHESSILVRKMQDPQYKTRGVEHNPDEFFIEETFNKHNHYGRRWDPPPIRPRRTKITNMLATSNTIKRDEILYHCSKCYQPINCVFLLQKKSCHFLYIFQRVIFMKYNWKLRNIIL